MRPRVSSLTTLVVPLLACGDAFSPPAGLQFSAASWLCTPETAIYLTAEPMQPNLRPPVPRLELVIPQPPTALTQSFRHVSVAGATAHYFTSATQFMIADSGRVRLDRATTHSVRGRVDLYFPSLQVTGDFNAPWLNQGVVCAYDARD